MRNIHLTQGPILRSLIRFALPMMAGNLLQQIYNLVDTLIVGHYLGAGALAAVGSAYTLMVFITSIIIGLCMGSGALFSASFGAGDMEAMRKDIFHSLIFIGSAALLMYVPVYAGMGVIRTFLRVPESLSALTDSYVSRIFSGLIFVFLYNFFAYILRSVGNSFIPLVFLAISSVVNILLDIVFVVYLHMGVAGAAWATVIAQTIAGLGIAVYAMRKLPVLRFNIRDIRFDPARLRMIIANDLMTGLQQSVMNFGILMIQGLVNSFGLTIMASFAAAVKIDTIAYMPAQEFGNAFSLFIAQNHGAGKQDRIRRGTGKAIITTVCFCVFVSVLIYIFAGSLMSCFVQKSERLIILEGIRYLRIEGAMYAGIGILFLWYGYFRAIGRPQISLVLTIISLGTRVLLSYTLAPNTAWGAAAIWWSIPIGWALADVAGMCFYTHYRKQTEKRGIAG